MDVRESGKFSGTPGRTRSTYPLPRLRARKLMPRELKPGDSLSKFDSAATVPWSRTMNTAREASSPACRNSLGIRAMASEQIACFPLQKPSISHRTKTKKKYTKRFIHTSTCSDSRHDSVGERQEMERGAVGSVRLHGG